MKSRSKPVLTECVVKQRGVVLFFALISLLAIMLAAVALIRSVDTGTLIAGNLAFKQAATTSGDAGTESAMAWVEAIQTANGQPTRAISDATHPLNITNAASGYYSNTVDNPDDADFVDLFADATWSAITAVSATTDASGNTVRYIIQRACRIKDKEIKNADCLYSPATLDKDGNEIKTPQDICDGEGCPALGQSPMMRITSRVTGPRNTVSYVQAFVY
ncbi:MAG: hypothetical protein NUV34_03980 [Sulfuricaulis sp.]|nr:hypothetical protein [Sulfuricaulis sp.]